uniref:Ig-like domain-containing protein n=1 Tax=Labrus bergylta TaxID=56723 RepID=A0A3Q3EWQ4_9LABR
LSLLLNTDIYLFSSGCTIYENFETKTVGVGDDVTLTCPRDASLSSTQLFWFRLISGDLPEVLGGTNAIDSNYVEETPGFTAKKEPGTDTGLYFCVKQEWIKMTVLKGTFLQIKGPEPSITSVVQDISQDPVHPGDLMTLQCSVLSESENNTCPGKHRVFWFRAGSDENHPSVIYTHGNRPGGCEESPEAHSPQKCVYSFSKTVKSSDASTYFCAVAACGEILFGNGTKIDIKGNSDNQTAVIALSLLSAALAISLIIIAFLIHIIKTKSCESSKGNRTLSQINKIKY